MFVGFIAVIVIILIIVTLMSTGATSGSGGVDQTKATKAIGEISALGQAIGFYKTTSQGSNYDGISVANLVSAGIVNADDLANSTTDMNKVAQAGGAIAALSAVDDALIASKAVPGLYYNVVKSTESNNQFVIEVITDNSVLNTTTDSGLLSALETSYAKLSTTGAVVTGTVATDGIAAIVLR